MKQVELRGWGVDLRHTTSITSMFLSCICAAFTLHASFEGLPVLFAAFGSAGSSAIVVFLFSCHAVAGTGAGIDF